jgi:uncharacterized protein (DUF58 family)
MPDLAASADASQTAAAAERPRVELPPQPSTAVSKRHRLDFSMTGLIYVGMMLFLGVAAINTQANLLFAVFGLMIGILLISGVISRLVIRRVKLRRILPDHGVVGRPMAATYEFANTKRFWPSLSITVLELDGVEGFVRQPRAYLLHVAPNSTTTTPVEMLPKRRGVHELGRHQLATSFPFGFVKRALTFSHRDRVLIRPPLAIVDRKLLRLCRAADSTGDTVRPRPGGQDEFYGVKEHRPGDNPRRIYWRRSARTGVLVSKEMAQVAPPRLLLLVDTCLPDDSLESHVRVERVIAMAGSLASAAWEDELSVGLCVWTGGWTCIHPSRGRRHCDDLLSTLAQLPLNREHDVGDLVAQARPLMESKTTVVLFTPRPSAGTSGDGGRTGLLTIAPDSQLARAWFRFDDSVDFRTVMPAAQQPTIEAAKKR